jgi:hypothetical protein
MPNKSLPTKIVSVIRIYLRQLAPTHKIFAESNVYHTPNLGTTNPPINEPMAIPRVP